MTNANSKDAIETKFSGKQDKGLTFEEFDKKALSWARKNYGNTYAKQLWENTLIDINNLDLKDDYDYFVFQEHCEYVYDMLCLESVKMQTLSTMLLSSGPSSGNLTIGSDSMRNCSAISKPSAREKQRGNFMQKEWKRLRA